MVVGAVQASQMVAPAAETATPYESIPTPEEKGRGDRQQRGMGPPLLAGVLVVGTTLLLRVKQSCY